nr:hypothetical protein [Rhodococcus sp. UFZ-B548]
MALPACLSATLQREILGFVGATFNEQRHGVADVVVVELFVWLGDGAINILVRRGGKWRYEVLLDLKDVSGLFCGVHHLFAIMLALPDTFQEVRALTMSRAVRVLVFTCCFVGCSPRI